MQFFRNRRSVRTLTLGVASGLLILCPARLVAQDTTTNIPKTHTVKKGDTLWDLAAKYLADAFRWPEIYRLNTDVVQDIGDVTLKVLNHIDPERDIQFTMGPIDSLDHASRLPNYGSKMGIDGTRKWSSEGFTRPWPDEIVMDEKTKALVDRKWKELGL